VHPASNRSCTLAQLLVATTFLLALGPSAAALAQGRAQEVNAAGTAPEQPRRRDRRRAAETDAASPDARTQDAGTPAAVAATAPTTIATDLVCKSVKVGGSKIARRVCATPEQWATQGRRASQAAQDAVQEIRDRSTFPAAPEVPVGLPQ
jgi:hypothetical protein